MSETNYFRLIEAYFEGNISPNDKAMLDAKIESDPLVKAEFDLQQNIVKGISNTRKLELKARLASIDLPTYTGILTGNSIKWLAGTVAGVTIFGSVLYWSLTSFDDNIKPIDIKANQEITFNNSIVEIPQIEEEESIKKTSIKPAISKEKIVVDKAEKDVTAKVKPQALMSFEDDKLFKNQNKEELENIASREIAHNRVDKTEIEFLDALEDNGSYHYRYYNSKLYLYGDFKEMPYQIIELNDKGKKQLFLSHDEEVYTIQDNTSKITELRKLKDEILKMEIQLIGEE